LVVIIILIGAGIFVVINDLNIKQVKVNEVYDDYVKFVSTEFGYSLEYPSSWWHNSVPTENLENAPSSAVNLLSMDEFGMGNYQDYKHPYLKDIMMLNFSILVYGSANGYTMEKTKEALGLNSLDNIYEKIGDYDTIIKIRDDSNHEVESARMYSKSYYIQNENNIYDISFAALNKFNIEQNSKIINNILISFKLL
ncbi:hypothetical protein KKF61_01405, partial [Patescibacteria group bacterium]|nr:hypothetical protein [Patescibacteria group bacterium]